MGTGERLDRASLRVPPERSGPVGVGAQYSAGGCAALFNYLSERAEYGLTSQLTIVCLIVLVRTRRTPAIDKYAKDSFNISCSRVLARGLFSTVRCSKRH